MTARTIRLIHSYELFEGRPLLDESQHNLRVKSCSPLCTIDSQLLSSPTTHTHAHAHTHTHARTHAHTHTHTHTGAHGATDITGFGILGHARNLAASQKAAVSFKIHTLPSMSLSG